MPTTPQLEPKPKFLERWAAHYHLNRRRFGTLAAVVFAVLLAFHVVTGRNGLNSWQQKRAENKALSQEIEQLSQENAHLAQHV